MKILQTSIFLVLISFSCFSQNIEKEKLNIVVFDKCTNNFITPKIEIDTITGLKNIRAIKYYVNRGNWISQAYSSSMINRKIPDTIVVPKILFSLGNEINSKRWIYLNCENPCNGIEIDFFKNGNKRIEGNFKNGEPIELKKYRENGKLFSESFYANFNQNFKRVKYYKQNGELFQYEIYKKENGKTLIKTFDKNGILTNRKIEKNYIEKAFEN